MVDVVSDMLVQIKNAQMVKKPEVLVPFSKFKFEIAKVLQKEGFVLNIEKVKRKIKKGKMKAKPFIKITLKYEDGTGAISGIKRISKPGQRIYKGYKDLKPTVKGKGVLIVSTSKGVMSHKEAKKLKVGGEVICEVW
ncbi:30S ribosomal protein S8 [Candidatus Parcubacteria bacterium]|nr:30S ribosomal protein S8 [Candidatus Parcubacteria bacterium]